MENENKKLKNNFKTFGTIDDTKKKIIRVPYIVDKNNSHFKNIQDAINHAELNSDNSDIKIASGFYLENLVIKKPNLKIECLDNTSEVFIMGEVGPTILIDLPFNSNITIQGIKLAHKGKLIKDCKTKNNENENYDFLGILKQFQKFKDFGVNRWEEDCLIFLKNGSLYLEKCNLTLNSLKNIPYNILSCIKLGKGTSCWIFDTEIKGNISLKTIGILSFYSNLIIKGSKIEQNCSGGIACYNNEENKINISENKIDFNKEFGILIAGINNKNVIEFNTINNNDGSGILVYPNQNCFINKNEIFNNQIGINSLSNDSKIQKNNIFNNFLDGIQIKTIEDFLCESLISENKIKNNKSNGIYISGFRNICKVINKNIIKSNKNAGIKIENQSHPFIFKNKISKNVGQGILIVENASAHIQSNTISDNIKANLAFGGDLSYHTVVLNNIIKEGRCEGIFIIGTSNCLIQENEIKDNNDGILMVTSLPIIRNNNISNNKNTGLMLLKDSRPKMNNNKILNNQEIGIYIRDKSYSILNDNIINNNKIQIIIEKKNKILMNIKKNNKIEGEIRSPYEFDCKIF